MTQAVDARTWKGRLAGRIAEDLGREIDAYEEALAAKRQGGGLPDEVFVELRLRRGAYGQRYDNGKRHDGIESRALAFPSGTVTKGPGTLWDAPGMMRIKIPFGGMNADQMDALADLAEEYGDEILHVTTRQDIQLHHVHIDDTPDLMRRLAAVGITTHEAGGNVVRNVTACPKSGCCPTETFDTTPYAEATHRFLLGHPDTQDFGRKLKVAFSGCAEDACALAHIHDAGLIARIREVDGAPQRGFALYVGGGLGAVPYSAQLLTPFLSETELLPTLQGMGRLFARLGEKKNRARARLKFLVAKLGLVEFRRLLAEERKALPEDPRHVAFLEDLAPWDGPRGDEPSVPTSAAPPDGFVAWSATNVLPQRQVGYAMVVVHLPLGDVSAAQMRALAIVARRFGSGTVRNTVEQNILLRWVRRADLQGVYAGLVAAGLSLAGAGTITDITACPGTDTCKLGIASSRALAKELSRRLAAQADSLDPAVRGLRIKASGCFNACGQHHVADIGFWGVSRKKGNYVVPHFQVVLGGQWHENGGAYGLAMGAAPAKNIPAVLDRITSAFAAARIPEETFQGWVARTGKTQVRASIEDLFAVPEYDADPSYYTDWGDPREFSIGDIGVGECAGEVVDSTGFDLLAAEREIFAAQDRLDQRDVAGAALIAYRAMLIAARALARLRDANVGAASSEVVAAFRTHLFDTGVFFDPYAGAKFARYFLRAHDEEEHGVAAGGDLARKRIDEAQLFVEAAHACYGRIGQEGLS